MAEEEKRLQTLYDHCHKSWRDEVERIRYFPNITLSAWVAQMSDETATGLLWNNGCFNKAVMYPSISFGYISKITVLSLPPGTFYDNALDKHLCIGNEHNGRPLFPCVRNNTLAKGIVRTCMWDDKAKDYIR